MKIIMVCFYIFAILIWIVYNGVNYLAPFFWRFTKEGYIMGFELMASMMCADFRNLEKEVKALDEGGIDSFHIDIMDGRYVPNYAMSLNDLRCIRGLTDTPLDVHLMVEHPNNTVELFIKSLKPGDTIYIHPEAEYHPSTTLQKVIDAGIELCSPSCFLFLLAITTSAGELYEIPIAGICACLMTKRFSSEMIFLNRSATHFSVNFPIREFLDCNVVFLPL